MFDAVRASWFQGNFGLEKKVRVCWIQLGRAKEREPHPSWLDVVEEERLGLETGVFSTSKLSLDDFGELVCSSEYWIWTCSAMSSMAGNVEVVGDTDGEWKAPGPTERKASRACLSLTARSWLVGLLGTSGDVESPTRPLYCCSRSSMDGSSGDLRKKLGFLEHTVGRAATGLALQEWTIQGKF